LRIADLRSSAISVDPVQVSRMSNELFCHDRRSPSRHLR
jgi:hypothetical protein